MMPGPDYAGIVTFYEDFPYAWWNDFRRLEDLGAERVSTRCRRTSAILPSSPTSPTSSRRKIMGISLYESQLERLFDGTKEMADAVRAYGRAIAELGEVDGIRRAVLGVRPRLIA